MINKAGNSIINQPRRLSIIGPQPDLACLPSGAVIYSNMGKRIKAIPIQIKTKLLNIVWVIILFDYAIMKIPLKGILKRFFKWTCIETKFFFGFFI